MRFFLAVFLTLWLVLPGVAQGVDPDWKALSERTESVLESGDASAGALTALRGELADWRARFQEAQTANAARIETLTAQIEAIGPPPEEGETEPPGIGIQRSELNRRLEELRAPVREAQASFTAADGLISEVDRLLEANRAAQLLSKAPAPVNPVNWPPTVAAIASWLKAFGQELYAPFATPTARAVWQARGGELGLLVLVAILLLWRSGVWLGKLRDRVALHEADSAVARVILLTISVVRLILPVAGLFAVVRILQLMGAEGLRVDAATTLLPLMGFTILMARWLSLQALPMRETAQAFLPVSPARRPAARFYALMLGILLAGAMAVEVITQTANDPVVSNAVAHLVLLVIAGINLFRMGKLFLSEGEAARADDDDGGGGFWAQVLRLIGRGLILVGVLSPLVAAVGYVNLANAALWPAALSLALIMFIGILQGFAFDLYAAAMRRPDTGRDALLPTLVGFVLALLSLPLFALIWGVLPSTLREWWTKFQLGFDFGESRISPGSFLTLALVFLVGYLMVRLLKGVLRTSVLPKTKLDTGGTNAILSGTGYIGITIAILMAVTAAGIDLSGLAIVAGALSVGVGFGLQTIVQNFVSGIILLIERPIKLGDWVVVQASGVEGFVREISVRSTRIETFDRQDMIVPNADLISGVVTNYTLNNASGRVVLTLGVAYGSDTERVERILQEVAEEHPMVILNPPPLVTFDGFGTNGLDFTVRVVLRDILFKVVVASELNHAIAKRFKAEGLEHPLPRRDVLLRNPEALQPEGPPST
ncbi:DUF3772 domain-containing protein [Jannaschia rubra]|uniref:Potassium efflux system KefA n=1 Tax=Jannaschia rubra TaxID=282197 RepID=A0A0M6XS11_9RHOB|nr:DUF3772 domain-containing protein [Jannaschia rubra]CTQ32971.1 Potassium efflux system KefA precursor [Jannaschia rubra]SFG59832.1 Small-conductance mechanosensitive channel [Jannaschia rubra]